MECPYAISLNSSPWIGDEYGPPVEVLSNACWLVTRYDQSLIIAKCTWNQVQQGGRRQVFSRGDKVFGLRKDTQSHWRHSSMRFQLSRGRVSRIPTLPRDDHSLFLGSSG